MTGAEIEFEKWWDIVRDESVTNRSPRSAFFYSANIHTKATAQRCMEICERLGYTVGNECVQAIKKEFGL